MAPRSRVKHSATEPLRSLIRTLYMYTTLCIRTAKDIVILYICEDSQEHSLVDNAKSPMRTFHIHVIGFNVCNQISNGKAVYYRYAKRALLHIAFFVLFFACKCTSV